MHACTSTCKHRDGKLPSIIKLAGLLNTKPINPFQPSKSVTVSPSQLCLMCMMDGMPMFDFHFQVV